MRATLVFPPSLCLPNTLYFALPVLAGALKRAGHSAHLIDLNLFAADRLLSMPRTLDLVARAREYVTRAAADAGDLGGRALRRQFDHIVPHVLAGPECKDDLRNRERFLQPAVFKRAFWTVVDALAFWYQLDPIFSPHSPTFLADLIDRQRREPWSPLTELYEDEMTDLACAGDPGLIGICVAFPEQAAEAVRLARRVKARLPESHVCLGGPLVTQFHEAWIGRGELFEWIDSFCVGDGDLAIAELASALEGRGAIERVTNLVWRDSRGVVRRNSPERVLTPVKDVPLADFDGFDWSLELTPDPLWPMMASRGCYWGRCTFCSIGWRENFQKAASDLIRRDVVDLVRLHGARWVQLQDSSLPPAAALALARAVQEEGLDACWGAGMKPEACFLDPAFCRELAAGGCRTLLMGIESASQRVLDRMDKGYRFAELPAMLRNLRDAGISVEALWFVGFPTETRTEALATVRWLYENRGLYGLSAFVGEYLLHPDTIVFDRPQDFGLELGARRGDTVQYFAREGMQPQENHVLEVMLAPMNNRTIVCNGCHLIHVAEGGLDVSGIARPAILPDAAVSFCTPHDVEPAAGPDDLTADGAQAFFNDDFGFRRKLEASWEIVRDEWECVPASARLPWTEDGAVEGSWSTVGLYGAGRRLDRSCDRMPRTAELLGTVEGIYSAGFSIVGPRTRLPRHCGEDRTILRCHLPIRIPRGATFEVGGLVRTWTEGRTLVFDDTLPHHSLNPADEEKVLLLIDFRVASRLARGLKPALAQIERDREYYGLLFPGLGFEQADRDRPEATIATGSELQA